MFVFYFMYSLPMIKPKKKRINPMCKISQLVVYYYIKQITPPYMAPSMDGIITYNGHLAMRLF